MSAETQKNAPKVGGYVEMFEAYLETQAWVTPAELPLVFHVRQLCAALDAADASATAAMSSAYLQAFTRLDRRRPGSGPGGALTDPAQTSIYDHID